MEVFFKESRVFGVWLGPSVWGLESVGALGPIIDD